MNSERTQRCEEFEALLVKKITGELLPEEKKSLEGHLVQCGACVSEARALTRIWQGMDSLTVPEIPAELYDKTRHTLLGRLRRQTAPSLRSPGMPVKGVWLHLLSVVAGLAVTGVSYSLVKNLIDLRVHHSEILISLFTFWAILLVACFWLIFRGKIHKSFSLDIVAAFAISITLLTLFIARLASEVDLVCRLEIAATYELVSRHFFGLESMFILGWGSYSCLASFIGSFLIGLHKSSYLPKNVFLASIFIFVLLFPAIYLQGSSHGHGVGILTFAAFGTFVGALVGTGVGSFTRRKVLPALA